MPSTTAQVTPQVSNTSIKCKMVAGLAIEGSVRKGEGIGVGAHPPNMW